MSKDMLHQTVNCYVCNGSGTINIPVGRVQAEKRRAAAVLLDQGFGIREVARMLGYKSPSSVKYIKEHFVLSANREILHKL